MAKVTLEQRHTIVSTLWSNGIHDAKSLHKLTSIPRSTIYDYVKKLKNGDTLNPLPRSGRPKNFLPKNVIFLIVLFQQINFPHVLNLQRF